MGIWCGCMDVHGGGALGPVVTRGGQRLTLECLFSHFSALFFFETVCLDLQRSKTM